MATLIDYILIPVDFWTIIHALALGIDMISSNSEYQNVINQSGHPIALVSMVTTLCETRLYRRDSGAATRNILHLRLDAVKTLSVLWQQHSRLFYRNRFCLLLIQLWGFKSEHFVFLTRLVPTEVQAVNDKQVREIFCGSDHMAITITRGWVPDKEAKQCMACKADFTTVKRRVRTHTTDCASLCGVKEQSWEGWGGSRWIRTRIRKRRGGGGGGDLSFPLLVVSLTLSRLTSFAYNLTRVLPWLQQTISQQPLTLS